jgi:hypothetical protein
MLLVVSYSSRYTKFKYQLRANLEFFVPSRLCCTTCPKSNRFSPSSKYEDRIQAIANLSEHSNLSPHSNSSAGHGGILNYCWYQCIKGTLSLPITLPKLMYSPELSMLPFDTEWVDIDKDLIYFYESFTIDSFHFQSCSCHVTTVIKKSHWSLVIIQNRKHHHQSLFRVSQRSLLVCFLQFS